MLLTAITLYIKEILSDGSLHIYKNLIIFYRFSLVYEINRSSVKW